MSSIDELQSRLYGYREKLSKLDGLLSSDPTNESFMSLKARLVTAITEVEAAITAATASAQTASRLASSSASASAATASAAAAASAASASAAAAAAAPAQRKPYTSAVISSAPVRSSLSLQGGVGLQGGAAEGGGAAAAAAAKPAFRLVAAVGGAKRSRGAEGEGDAAADAAAEEAAESKGQYADLHIPDNLKIHLTDTEEQKQRKQKKIKALKLQHRQKASEDMARAATNSWQAFQSMARR